MAFTKIEHIIVLLLSPPTGVHDHFQLSALQVSKSETGTRFRERELNAIELGNYFTSVPDQAREILFRFQPSELAKVAFQSEKEYDTQQPTITFREFHQVAMQRHFQHLLETLKPYAGLFNWYHRVQNNKNAFTLKPCSISNLRPQLEFELKQETTLQVQTMVILNGQIHPVQSFTRSHFLLESKDEYFLLSYRDYKTLEWLQETDWSYYTGKSTEFAGKILAVLDKDYKVNRNNLLPTNLIDSVPENQVLLSELNNQFLVFTPRWNYDGFIVEGPCKESYEILQNGDIFLIKRKGEAEQAFLQLLQSLHTRFPNQANGFHYLSFDEAKKKQWFLKTYHWLLEHNIQVIGMDMLQHFRYSSNKLYFYSEVLKTHADDVILQARIAFGKEEVPLIEMQKLVLAEQRSVLLKDDTIGIIDDAWLKQYGQVFRHGRISGREIQVPKWLAFSEEAAVNGPVFTSVLPEGWRQKWVHWQEKAEPQFKLPGTVKASLRPYQLKGIEWMRLLSEAGAGACLADDMGLGKTLQTICFLASILEVNPSALNLVVCPASLIYNWQQEFKKFAPAIKTRVHHGTSRSLNLQNEKSSIIITTYGTLRAEITSLCRINFSIVVLDESHYIKNPASQITRAVNQLQASTRIALSGTPIMNNTFDLYAQLNFILPGLFRSREFFKKEYADNIDRNHDPQKVAALKKLTDPFVLRRTKQQVASDLPVKTEMIMWCNMSSEQKELYEQVRTSVKANVLSGIKQDGLNKSRLAVLQGMLKLRQVCDSPLLLPVEEQPALTPSVKVDLLMNELANNLKEHKVLVFSQFTSMLRLLATSCQNIGISYFHFDGQTPPLKRAEMVNRFQQQGDATNVFLISLKAGNTGLNLTAADYVFLFDPWWNTAVQQQAIDRTHRIGQTKSIFAYKMVCKDTIEEKILEIQDRKKKLADDLITEDEGFVKSLTEPEIAYLFS